MIGKLDGVDLGYYAVKISIKGGGPKSWVQPQVSGIVGLRKLQCSGNSLSIWVAKAEKLKIESDQTLGRLL